MLSEAAPATDPDGWDAALVSTFEILLDGRPVIDPVARYGVYYAPFDEFLFPNHWATPEAMTSAEPRHLPDPDGEYPFSPWTWRFDLSESLFHFDADLVAGAGPWGEGGHKSPRPFDDAFVADLRSVASANDDSHVLVLGAQLGPLLSRHGVSLTDEKSRELNCWLGVLLRVATDGTLADAMRAATFTERGPEHLVSVKDMRHTPSVEELWDIRLSAVTHPALQEHLRMLCVTENHARSEGGHYVGTGYWPGPDVLEAVGCSLVAGWLFGESETSTAVVRLPD
ncbi:hypothetical protein [Streptomyces sp. NPDC059256]|uniref:hypothetical protein n=1 Tax=Streptomyces sp. NPDC059256 TaxID=3346794 RepID=UPI0036A735C8